MLLYEGYDFPGELIAVPQVCRQIHNQTSQLVFARSTLEIQV